MVTEEKHVSGAECVGLMDADHITNECLDGADYNTGVVEAKSFILSL